MEFKSLNELVRIVENELSVQFYGNLSVLRKGVLKVLARVIGGMLYLLSLIAKRVWKNRFISTCDNEALDGFGEEYGIPHKPPQKAEGYVLVTLASGTSEVEIESGTLITDSTTGLDFEVTATTTITSSSNLLPVRAAEAGDNYNLWDGELLEFKETTVAGVEKMVADSIVGGCSIEVMVDGNPQIWGETSMEYRERLLNRVRNQPHGGSKNDYWQWVMSFPYVTDAFVFPNTPNTNSVSIPVANYHNSDYTVPVGKTSVIEDWINDDSRRPITADIRVFSVTPIEVKIKASVAPFSASVRNSVTSAIKTFFRKMKPGSSFSFSEFSVEIRANSSADLFTVSEFKVKSGNSWNALTSVQMNLNAANRYAEVAKVLDSNLELVNGEG